MNLDRQLARFTRTIIILRFVHNYGVNLKQTIQPTTISWGDKLTTQLAKDFVAYECDRLLMRRLRCPTKKGKLVKPTWALESMDETWAQYEEGLITWTEFINEWVYTFHAENRKAVAEWDSTNINNNLCY